MKISGLNIDDHKVISGVGTMCFTHGIALEVALGYLKQKDMVVDWVDYIQTALLDGHNPRTIRARIESSTADIYDHQYSSEVVKRVDIILAWLTSDPE